jgi:hypothetical protein
MKFRLDGGGAATGGVRASGATTPIGNANSLRLSGEPGGASGSRAPGATASGEAGGWKRAGPPPVADRIARMGDVARVRESEPVLGMAPMAPGKGSMYWPPCSAWGYHRLPPLSYSSVAGLPRDAVEGAAPPTPTPPPPPPPVLGCERARLRAALAAMAAPGIPLPACAAPPAPRGVAPVGVAPRPPSLPSPSSEVGVEDGRRATPSSLLRPCLLVAAPIVSVLAARGVRAEGSANREDDEERPGPVVAMGVTPMPPPPRALREPLETLGLGAGPLPLVVAGLDRLEPPPKADVAAMACRLRSKETCGEGGRREGQSFATRVLGSTTRARLCPCPTAPPTCACTAFRAPSSDRH